MEEEVQLKQHAISPEDLSRRGVAIEEVEDDKARRSLGWLKSLLVFITIAVIGGGGYAAYIHWWVPKKSGEYITKVASDYYDVKEAFEEYLDAKDAHEQIESLEGEDYREAEDEMAQKITELDEVYTAAQDRPYAPTKDLKEFETEVGDFYSELGAYISDEKVSIDYLMQVRDAIDIYVEGTVILDEAIQSGKKQAVRSKFIEAKEKFQVSCSAYDSVEPRQLVSTDEYNEELEQIHESSCYLVCSVLRCANEFIDAIDNGDDAAYQQTYNELYGPNPELDQLFEETDEMVEEVKDYLVGIRRNIRGQYGDIESQLEELRQKYG